jgi:hypothetical protein
MSPRRSFCLKEQPGYLPFENIERFLMVFRQIEPWQSIRHVGAVAVRWLRLVAPRQPGIGS